MTGDDIRKLRERRGLSRDELAALITTAIGGGAKSGDPYTGETVGRWERGRKPAGKVVAFLEELAVSELEGVAGGLEPDDRPLVDDDGAGDTAPGAGSQGPDDARLGLAQPAVGRGVYTRACEELWELVATGVGMVGAATGNMALVNDGAIIANDKAALGAAWGRLAETNDTFRRMLVGMTEGGAWLQVALVSGTTLSKCWGNHQEYAAHRRRQSGDDGDAGVREPVAA